MSEQEKTHFGFKTVDKDQKAGLVKGVFDSVASQYDVMNDAMSFGLHRLWKQYTINVSGIRKGNVVLDVASGTGDLALKIAQRVGPTGKVVASDINEKMLACAKERFDKAGLFSGIEFVVANAESLPFSDHSFDCITLGFGLRNMTNKDTALAELYRVLKPGGRLLVLEFSKPTQGAFEKIYDWYSFNCLPKLGKWIAGDENSYQYLVESIRKHPDQAKLKHMMLEAGFAEVSITNFASGAVALHKGLKL